MITITPKPLKGTVSVVSSKSLSHRFVMAAALAEGKSEIKNVLASDDLSATKKALEALGARFEKDFVYGGKIQSVASTIDCLESGSTLRFFIPIAMLQAKEMTFIGRGKLPERPQDVYQKLFKDKYMFKHPEGVWLPLTVKGPLNPGLFELPGDVSSQFITGLLYALPLLKGDSQIVLSTPLESKGYVDLTLDVLRQFGIKITWQEHTFFIPGNQKYQTHDVKVEGDYSAAAFFIVAGLIGAEIRLKNLDPRSLQGDKMMIDFVKRMGGELFFEKDELVILPSETKGTTIDLGQTPDLGPILMVLAAVSKGVTKFIHAERLRIKESDRIDAMVDNLRKMGVKITATFDTVTVHGRDTLKGDVILKTYGDHRIAMSLAVASIKAQGKVMLDDETVVSKSYPNFFDEFRKLGGEVS